MSRAHTQLFDLELLDGRDEVQPELPCGRHRINRFIERPQADLALVEVVHDFEKLADIPAEPGEGMDDQHIAGAGVGEGGVQFWAFGSRTADGLAENALHTRSLKGVYLKGMILGRRATTRITNQHSLPQNSTCRDGYAAQVFIYSIEIKISTI